MWVIILYVNFEAVKTIACPVAPRIRATDMMREVGEEVSPPSSHRGITFLAVGTDDARDVCFGLGDWIWVRAGISHRGSLRWC